jgi:hypothetical protein
MKVLKRVLFFLMIVSFSIGSTQVGASASEGNLLLPSLGDITINGITITRNEDNNYTFTGTSTSDLYVSLLDLSLGNTSKATVYASATKFPYQNGNITLSSHYVSGSISGSGGYLTMGNASTNNIAIPLTGSGIEEGYAWSSDAWLLAIWVKSGTTFTDYNINIQLEEGISASAYEPYTPVLSYQENFLVLTGAWLTGIWVMIGTSITSALSVFYDSTPITGGFTTLGYLALFGLAFTIVLLGITYVKKMIT